MLNEIIELVDKVNDAIERCRDNESLCGVLGILNDLQDDLTDFMEGME